MKIGQTEVFALVKGTTALRILQRYVITAITAKENIPARVLEWKFPRHAVH